MQFLHEEAARLDDRDLHGWLELLTEDVEYVAPVRLTRELGSDEFSEDAYFYEEDMETLRTRVERFDTEYAWSENPPSRTRRYVTNVRPRPDGDEVRVRNNLLLYRARGTTTDYRVFTAERHDTLRWVGDELRLAGRRVLLDQTILPTNNLSVFL